MAQRSPNISRNRHTNGTIGLSVAFLALHVAKTRPKKTKTMAQSRARQTKILVRLINGSQIRIKRLLADRTLSRKVRHVEEHRARSSRQRRTSLLTVDLRQDRGTEIDKALPLARIRHLGGSTAPTRKQEPGTIDQRASTAEVRSQDCVDQCRIPGRNTTARSRRPG